MGSFLNVSEILVLGSTCKRLSSIFGSIHNIYEWECKREYTSDLNVFK